MMFNGLDGGGCYDGVSRSMVRYVVIVVVRSRRE
jgi:hypothetical protein